MGKKSRHIQSRAEQWSETIMSAAGSPTSILVHTFLFGGILSLVFFGVNFEKLSIALTTIVSLEAIYLSLFIQMSVNKSRQTIEEVEEDIEEIGEDIGEIEEEIDELGEDIEEISDDIDKIQEGEDENDEQSVKSQATLGEIQGVLEKVLKDIEAFKVEKKQ
ncbi:MAG: hypothetical protein AAB495_03035 [Patescibacteria group bacterium]